MNLLVTCEFRFFQTPDGKVWTTSSFKYDFWCRYLTAFEKVTVIARIKPCQIADKKWQQADGTNVSFFALPYYQGLIGLALKLPALILRLKQAMKLNGLFLCRVPSQTATLLIKLLPQKRAYALEVIGDPYDVFSAGVGNKLIAPLLRASSTKALKVQCQKALGVSYVTQDYLQQRYPPGRNSITSHYSSIMLSDEQFADQAKNYHSPARKLLFVGSVEQLYKAPEVLLDALSLLIKYDSNYSLTFVGSGQYLSQLEQQAAELGIKDNVNFVGEVASHQVLNYLQQADVFVLASRTEGLPRATIEAMAQGMACVGSDAGGIPELLAPEYCVPAGNSQALYATLKQLTNDIDCLNQQAKRNYHRANDYRLAVLTERRNQFYCQLAQTNEVKN